MRGAWCRFACRAAASDASDERLTKHSLRLAGQQQQFEALELPIGAHTDRSICPGQRSPEECRPPVPV